MRLLEVMEEDSFGSSKDDDNDQEWRAMVNDYSSIIFSSYNMFIRGARY